MEEGKRYETLAEVEERMAGQERPAPFNVGGNADYGKSAYPRIPWYRRPVPWGLAIFAAVLIAAGILFSIGLTLHEAYDAQTAMGEHLNPPPFNGLFETIHGWLAGWMWIPAQKIIGGWMWFADGVKWA
jgi:hypothetical protein